MNCQAFHKFLNESENAADHDLPLALQDHLHVCPSCQKAWHLQRRLLAALEREPALTLSPAFTAQIMAKLPAEPLKKRRFDFDAILMLALIPAAFAGLWYAAKFSGLRFISIPKLQALYVFIEKLVQDFVHLTFGKMQEILVHAFGQDMMAQALEVIFISGVTFLVAKSAVLLEKRIRRLLNG